MKHKWSKQLSVLGSLVLGVLMLTMTGCSKEKDRISNEEELITTVSLKFTKVGDPLTSFTYTFRDTDGEGGNPPSQFDEIVLAANTSYTCTITLLNESVNPAEDITEEIEAEAEDHQFYFIPQGEVEVDITVTDTDSQNLPVGIVSAWETGVASTGIVRVVLKHKPGSKAANDPVTKGDTDIDLGFVVKVQ